MNLHRFIHFPIVIVMCLFFRAFFITLFKHLIFVGGRACYRTALELCKVLLSLDPEGDPLAVVLILDFYALRAKEYDWLINFAGRYKRLYNFIKVNTFANDTYKQTSDFFR